MQENRFFSPSLHRFAFIVALSALGLLAIGGLVTSHGVGMAVPDWPTSYGYNMFALPLSLWLTGGVFHEHTHRVWASVVGLLVVALTRWLGGKPSRRALLIIGAVETLGGLLLPLLGAEWRGAGQFLSGIGGVVLLAALVWVRNAPAPRPLPALGCLAFWLVQVQGLLGGLRVVLDAHAFAGTKLGLVFGVVHGCLGQVFLVLLAVIVLLTSRWSSRAFTPTRADASLAGPHAGIPASVRTLLVATTALILVQLLIGATMRHQHAGLPIWDFPLAHGQWWPDTSPEAIARYNAARVEVSAQDPITAFQVILQMIHRLVAVAILPAVSVCCWRVHRATAEGHPLRQVTLLWLGLVMAQAALGAWTLWSNKAADIATLHVVGGALALVTGSLICVMAFRFNFRCCGAEQFLASEAVRHGPDASAAGNQAQSAT